MFSSNQVTIKDLFSSTVRGGNRSENYETVTDNSQNNSQYPYSQLDFAESQIQDVASQFSSGSQSSDSPGKKFYGMYNNKAGLFARDLQHKSNTPQPIKVSYQQQLLQNKAKARERDERDLLNSMVNCMKECSAEVKAAVSIVKDNVQHGVSVTQKGLEQHLQKIQEDLDQHKQEMVKALQVKDEMKDKIATLIQDLAVRDAHIEELQKQLHECREEQNKQIIKELQKSFFDGCEETKEHIVEAYKGHKQDLKVQAQILDTHKKELIQHTQCMQKNIISQNKGVIHQLQSSVNEDIQNCIDEEKRARDNLSHDVKIMVEEMQKCQREDVKALLRKQLQEMDDIGEKKQQEIFQDQIKQLKDLKEKHRQEINNHLKKELFNLSHEQETLIKQMISHLWEKEMKNTMIIQHKQQKNIEDELQKRYERELLEMKQRYEKEVEAILSQQKQNKIQDMSHNGYMELYKKPQSVMTETYVRPQHNDEQQNVYIVTESGYCSEGNWESRNFYKKKKDHLSGRKLMRANSYSDLSNFYNINSANETVGSSLAELKKPLPYHRDSRNPSKPFDKEFSAEKQYEWFSAQVNDPLTSACNSTSKLNTSSLSESKTTNTLLDSFSDIFIEKNDLPNKHAKNRSSETLNDSRFRSPLLAKRNWNTKDLFAMTKPSPVAKVLPQVQQPEVISTNIEKPNTSSSIKSEMGNAASDTREILTKKKVPRKRKRKSMYGKRKKTNRNKEHKENNTEYKQESQVEDTLYDPDTEEEEEYDNGQYISNRFLNEDPANIATYSKYQRQAMIEKSNSNGKSLENASNQLNIYEFKDDTDCERGTYFASKPRTLQNNNDHNKKGVSDERWEAACKIKPSNYKSCYNIKQVAGRDLLNSPNISQDENDCGSVGSSPSYSVADVILKRKSASDYVADGANNTFTNKFSSVSYQSSQPYLTRTLDSFPMTRSQSAQFK